MKFKEVEHTADIKFEISARTLEEIFENSALALASYIAKDIKIKTLKSKILEIKADDLNNLLYNFLDDLIFLMDAENFIVSRVQVVSIKDNKLKAKVFGDKSTLYKGLTHVKAATYAEMHIKQVNKRKWEAQFVLDV